MAKLAAIPVLIAIVLLCPSVSGAADLDSAWQYVIQTHDNLHLSGSNAIPDSVIYRWINIAASKLEQYAVVQKCTIITMVGNEPQYTMPSDFVQGTYWSGWFEAAKPANARRRFWGAGQIRSEDVEHDEKTPQENVSVFSDTVTVLPPPVDGDFFHVEYGAEITRFYTDSSVTNLEPQYRYGLLDYASYRAGKAIGSDMAADYFKSWEDLVALVVQRYAKLEQKGGLKKVEE